MTNISIIIPCAAGTIEADVCFTSLGSSGNGWDCDGDAAEWYIESAEIISVNHRLERDLTAAEMETLGNDDKFMDACALAAGEYEYEPDYHGD